MLSHVLDRLRATRRLAQVVLATTDLAADDAIEALAETEGVVCFRGSELDVLSRYLGAAALVDAERIVRVTSDCPLIDPLTVDLAIDYFQAHSHDYVSAGVAGGFPRGLDTEVMTRAALERAGQLATDGPYREHVTLYLYRHPEVFSIGQVPAPTALRRPQWRLCVDEEADFALVSEIYRRLWKPGDIIPISAVVDLLDADPRLASLNAHVDQKKP